MTSNASQAKKWVDSNVILSEHCDIEYSDLYSSLETLLERVSSTLSRDQAGSVETNQIDLQLNKKEKHYE